MQTQHGLLAMGVALFLFINNIVIYLALPSTTLVKLQYKHINVQKCHHVPCNADYTIGSVWSHSLCTIGHAGITIWTAHKKESRQTLAPTLCSESA